MDKVFIDNMEFHGETMELFGIKVMLIKGTKGALGCAYLNLAAAEKFAHPLAIVSGVASYEDMLNAEVKSVSSAADDLGVTPGISGREALKIMG